MVSAAVGVCVRSDGLHKPRGARRVAYSNDPLTCNETLLAEFPFDNDWYVENMVGYLVSLRTTPDADGEPLPALSLRIGGESVTSPEPMYLRPGYLS